MDPCPNGGPSVAPSPPHPEGILKKIGEVVESDTTPIEAPKKRVCLLKSLKSVDEAGPLKAEYDNFAPLIEVVGTIVLPSGSLKNLRVLLDIGATCNYINQDLVTKFKITSTPGQELVSLGTG